MYCLNKLIKNTLSCINNDNYSLIKAINFIEHEENSSSYLLITTSNGQYKLFTDKREIIIFLYPYQYSKNAKWILELCYNNEDEALYELLKMVDEWDLGLSDILLYANKNTNKWVLV